LSYQALPFAIKRRLVRGKSPKTPVRKDEFMYRNKSFIVRMTSDELANLDNKIKRTGMSREQYIRTLCKNKIPVEIPPADYHALIREVRAVGNNMHQIAYKAQSMGLLDVPMYKRNAELVTALADKLTAVCLPRGS